MTTALTCSPMTDSSLTYSRCTAANSRSCLGQKNIFLTVGNFGAKMLSPISGSLGRRRTRSNRGRPLICPFSERQKSVKSSTTKKKLAAKRRSIWRVCFSLSLHSFFLFQLGKCCAASKLFFNLYRCVLAASRQSKSAGQGKKARKPFFSSHFRLFRCLPRCAYLVQVAASQHLSILVVLIFGVHLVQE
jgi:hypothetical protein